MSLVEVFIALFYSGHCLVKGPREPTKASFGGVEDVTKQVRPKIVERKLF